ncbi:MAG: hypothetical protein B0W54_23550 [Cellvibrio sp. 79]|nr:MAG: hypothetical protein B0W54_23550 [Cellvibrio sp. 79]
MEQQKQYKSLDDLKKIIVELEGCMTRPVKRGQHPTLYPKVKEGEYRTVSGIRVVDYILSVDEKWVLPHNQKGLSFSANWSELKRVYRMLARVKTTPLDVHWILQGADIPDDMEFVEDERPNKKGHYFLTVKRQITIYKLVNNLKWIADRMTVIRNVEKAL